MQHVYEIDRIRTRFTWRWAVNITICAGVLAVSFAVLLLLVPLLAALLVALILGTGAFVVLSQRTFAFVCPHCEQHIEPNNTPWICPNKGCRNDNVHEFPFIHRCEHCDYFPKGYECHHCHKPIFFGKDKQRAGIARCANASARQTRKSAKGDGHGEKLDRLKKSIELRQLDVQDKQLAVELKGLDQALTPEMSIEEQFRAELKDEDSELRLRARIDEEYPNDEEMRTRRHLLVDKIMREKLR